MQPQGSQQQVLRFDTGNPSKATTEHHKRLLTGKLWDKHLDTSPRLAYFVVKKITPSSWRYAATLFYITKHDGSCAASQFLNFICIKYVES